MMGNVKQWFNGIWKYCSVYKPPPLTAMTTHKLNADQYIGWHDDKKCAFYLKLGDETSTDTATETATDTAILEYRWVREDVADLFHTGVPSAYRGKGIAKILAQTALDYMVKTDAKMILSCSYLEKYVKDNPLPKYTERLFYNDNKS